MVLCSVIQVRSRDHCMQTTQECRWWLIHPDFETHGQSHLKSETGSTSGPTKLISVKQKLKKNKKSDHKRCCFHALSTAIKFSCYYWKKRRGPFTLRVEPHHSESDFVVSVPNFQWRLVWQVNWKCYEPNKAMSLSRSLFAWCGLTISDCESEGEIFPLMF